MHCLPGKSLTNGDSKGLAARALLYHLPLLLSNDYAWFMMITWLWWVRSSTIDCKDCKGFVNNLNGCFLGCGAPVGSWVGWMVSWLDTCLVRWLVGSIIGNLRDRFRADALPQPILVRFGNLRWNQIRPMEQLWYWYMVLNDHHNAHIIAKTCQNHWKPGFWMALETVYLIHVHYINDYLSIDPSNLLQSSIIQKLTQFESTLVWKHSIYWDSMCLSM